MSDTVGGPYGESRITRDKEGVTVSFAKPDGTRGEHREDYRYCASLILHMIEGGTIICRQRYLTSSVRVPSPLLQCLGLWIYTMNTRSVCGRSRTLKRLRLRSQSRVEAEPQVQQTEPIEKVEGEVIDQSGNIIKPAVFNASYPKSLRAGGGNGGGA